MTILRSLTAIARSTGEGPVDWNAVTDATKGVTSPGSIRLTDEEIDRYRTDVRDAQSTIGSISGIDFEIPDSIQIQNRHHWIDANISTFQRVMKPVEARWRTVFPDTTRKINSGTMTIMLSFLAKNVLGQYDPILLAEADEDHALYFVHPNIERVAAELDVDFDRFRRWIAFHEVAHAAEFGAAPWLSDHLESRMQRGIDALARGELDRQAFADLDVAMTAVEGFAEVMMDRAFDQEYVDLRDKLERRRRGGGPIARFVRRVMGLGIKRRQYERGKRFFEAIVDRRGIEGASAVWEGPNTLPTADELDHPDRWLARVSPR